MPSIEPIRWAHPGTASATLKPLIDRGGGVVENVIVRLALDRRYPLRGQRYRLARYTLVGGAGWWIDAATQRPLYGVIGFRLAE